jgi:hypothetical protein
MINARTDLTRRQGAAVESFYIVFSGTFEATMKIAGE